MKKALVLILLVILGLSLLTTALALNSDKQGVGHLKVFVAEDFEVVAGANFATACDTDANAGGSFVVWTGEKIGIEITGITEFTSLPNNMEVWIKGPDFTVKIPVSYWKYDTSSGTIRVIWLVGDLNNDEVLNLEGGIDKDIPWCTTMPVSYGTPGGGQLFTEGILNANIGHLHAVPEYIYGGLAAFGSCFVGFLIFKNRKIVKLA